MPRRDFKFIMACSNRAFQSRVISRLKKTYTAAGAKDFQDLLAKLKKKQYSMVIVDHDFGKGLKTNELQSRIARYCPNIIYIVYTPEERKAVAKKVRRYRAIDYILFSSKILEFTEKVHKAVRWVILQDEVTNLGVKITRVAQSIKSLSGQIEKAY